MRISTSLREDFLWWEKIINHVDNPIRLGHFQLEVFSDASFSGWGAFCNGETVSGYWSQDERMNHINYLVARCFYGTKMFLQIHD